MTAWPPAPPGALRGMRVIDLSQQLPGPYCAALLASLGASVIKVEPPGGDLGRVVDPPMYRTLNQGKKVIELDLKTADGRSRLHELIPEATVVVEAWRAGVARRLAADATTLSAINSDLLYCAISGFGSSGPLARRAAHDLNVQAVAGAVTGDPGSGTVGVAWVDLATGQHAALAIVSAWHAGQSGVIDIAMLDLAASWSAIKPGALTDIEPAYGVVVGADASRFAIAVLEDKVWLKLCDAFGWSDWASDPAMATPSGRRAAVARIRARLDACTSVLDGDTIARLAHEHDLPITRIDPPEPGATAQLAVRPIRGTAIPSPQPWDTAP